MQYTYDVVFDCCLAFALANAFRMLFWKHLDRYLRMMFRLIKRMCFFKHSNNTLVMLNHGAEMHDSTTGWQPASPYGIRGFTGIGIGVKLLPTEAHILCVLGVLFSEGGSMGIDFGTGLS